MRLLLPLAILSLLLCRGAAHGELLSPEQLEWAYKWTPGAILLEADGNPLAGVTFTDEPWKVTVGTSAVLVTELRTISGKVFSADPPAFDTLSGSGAYSLGLLLSLPDNGTVYTASLDFTGALSGTFSSEHANLANTFGPESQQAVWLGSYRLEVTLFGYTPPGPQEQPGPGSIRAHVSVSRQSLPTLPPDYEGGAVWAAAPEPATLLSSLLGLACLGAAACRCGKGGRR